MRRYIESRRKEEKRELSMRKEIYVQNKKKLSGKSTGSKCSLALQS